MDFQFERFTAHGKRFSPQISIRSNGSIGFSQGALHRAKIADENWFVVLFYDRAKNVLGIKPTREKDEEGAVRVVVRKAESEGQPVLNAFISAKSFLHFYSIPFAETASYETEWNEQLGMLITFLSKSDKDSPAAGDSSNGPPD